MSESWRPDEERGGVLKQEQDYDQNFPTCMNCGQPKREANENGGWCDECSGRKADPAEAARRCETQTLRNARLILARGRVRGYPAREILWWERRVAALEKSLGVKASEVA